MAEEGSLVRASRELEFGEDPCGSLRWDVNDDFLRAHSSDTMLMGWLCVCVFANLKEGKTSTSI